ncbi:probable to GDP/GTP exchange factor Rom2p [Melanopsichium pennsylvanicum]|uniref:Probable to GDP/GTP exchange factor Rom2p n=2 Tax=Melanopsichium pennsylvanicum TaxID=63383 RepID=A0AAJ5C6H1_9BASI|nr:probable to GDP/GTP exchange factor Rom2p [Melanopsichium pennsylvanicum 4]SNX85831.1 probable to GDP/GTP exchange factor Rom2p [Melanopsichium pennsylvanicum]
MPAGAGPGAPLDKRTTAYENIFGRPTAKPKGPQQQSFSQPGQAGVFRAPPNSYAVNQRWNGIPPGNGYGAAPFAPNMYIDPSMVIPPNAATQTATPSYYPSVYTPSHDPSHSYDSHADRRISTVPSVASSDPRSSISGYSQYNGLASSAADAYRGPPASTTPASAYASHYLSQQGNGTGPSSNGINGNSSTAFPPQGQSGYSNPNAASPRASIVSDFSLHSRAEGLGAELSYGLDKVALNSVDGPPRLPSIESSNTIEQSTFWFGDGDAARTPTSPMSVASRKLGSFGSQGQAAQLAVTSSNAASLRIDGSGNGHLGLSADPGTDEAQHTASHDQEVYSNAFFENLLGTRSPASSIYGGDGRRRGSMESDRQSIANSIYTLPGAQNASRAFYGSTTTLPPNASGYFAGGAALGTMTPYNMSVAVNSSAAPGGGWDRPPRARTASSSTQAAQAAYAPSFANQQAGASSRWDDPSEASTIGRGDYRSLSFGQNASRPSFAGPASPPGSIAGGRSQVMLSSRRGPLVYPAMLSKVAEAFRARVILSERTKDGLTYSDAFDGREAVDKIAYIIKTTDRNLALLLGRALDAQKFFHDVTYDHRLRDSASEIYQFKVRVPTSGFGVEGDFDDDRRSPGHPTPSRGNSASSVGPTASLSSMTSSRQPASTSRSPAATTPATSIYNGIQSGSALDDEDDDDALPTGVFTLLTDCYSPTCSRDRLCYSIACPRRLEQQARLNMKPQAVLKRSVSRESINDTKERGALWADSVSKEVFDSLDDTERKRQEAINEVVYTERDFVADMEYLRDQWVKPLRTSEVIPEDHRDDFVTQVFWNVLEIHAVNAKLSELLTKRQKQGDVVDRIGDILLEMVPHFQPFVKYGAHQLYGKYEFEKEKSANSAFAKFVDETERLPQSRKLELNGYLTKPTTRLARYPLLLEQVVKYTPEDHPDKQTIPKVIKIVKEFLTKVNVETGKSENRFTLAQLDQQLVFKQGEAVDLRLRDEQRELVFKGPLKKRGGTQSESAELQVFLFDHALLMVKPKVVNKHELYKVYRKPIPLELLIVTVYDEVPTGKGSSTRPKSVMSRTSTGTRYSGNPGTAPKQDAKTGYALTFTYLGKKGYSMTLWASTFVSRKKWFESIESRQEILRQRSNIFDTITLSENFFLGPNRVNCSVPFDFGRRIIYGTDDGVYLSDLREKARPPTKVLPLPGVTQVDVLEEYQILIVLAEKSVHTFTLDALDPSDPMGSLKRGRRISSHTSFFRAGICLGRTLVCVVKSSSLSSTIKTLEPIEQNVRGKKQPTFKKLLQGGQDTLRVFKEFYIPTESSSIHFLKTKLCVGCTKGFEIVDLETLDTQGLLDPADTSLDFVHRRENVKPIAIYRISGEFLLCYDEFAFYVNKNGWRAKGNWIIHWEGNPSSFAYHHPYVLAFEPSFVEVRHVETGALHQVITGVNLRCLFADVPPPTPSLHQQNAQAVAAMRASSFNAAMMGPYGRPMPPLQNGMGPPMTPYPVARPGFAPPPNGAIVPGTPVVAGGFGGIRPGAPRMQRPGAPPFPGAPVAPMVHPAAPFPPAPRPQMPYAFGQASTPRPPPVQRNPVWESVAASRNQIVFIGDTTVFCVRLHTDKDSSSGSVSSSSSSIKG